TEPAIHPAERGRDALIAAHVVRGVEPGCLGRHADRDLRGIVVMRHRHAMIGARHAHQRGKRPHQRGDAEGAARDGVTAGHFMAMYVVHAASMSEAATAGSSMVTWVTQSALVSLHDGCSPVVPIGWSMQHTTIASCTDSDSIMVCSLKQARSVGNASASGLLLPQAAKASEVANETTRKAM